MKKILVMLYLGIVISSAAHAQTTSQPERKPRFENRGEWQKRTPEERAAKQTEILKHKLDLTAKQQEKVQALNLKHAQQMEAFRAKHTADASGNRNQANRDEMRTIRTDWEKELKAILTKEQVAKYEASREEMKDRHHGARHEKGRGYKKHDHDNKG